jgi:hypothetical protein
MPELSEGPVREVLCPHLPSAARAASALASEPVQAARNLADRKLVLRRGPPSTVIAYVALNAAVAVALLVYWGPDRRSLIGAVVLAIALLGFLRGLWIAWAFLMAVEFSFYVSVVANRPAWWWWVVPVKLALLALLLSRPTGRYVRRGNAAIA